MPTLECPIREKDWAREISQRDGISVPCRGQPVGKAVEEAGPWEPAVQQIVGYQDLGDNWDGFRAKAPSCDLLASAIGLAYLLYEKGVEPPQRVVPGVEGSVILEWQFADGAYGEVEIVRPLYAEVMLIKPGQPAKHWTLPTE